MARLSLKTKTTTNDLVVNIGTSVNDKTGDPLRTAFGKLKDSINQAEANFIELYASVGADAAANELVNGSYTISLGADGTLNLPATADTSAVIQSTTHIKINANGKIWSFANDGNLTLPPGADILSSSGSSVLGGGSEAYFGTINRTDVVISKYLITSVDTGTNTFVVAGNAVSDTFAYQINIDTQSITYTLAKLQPATHLNGETTVYIDDIDDTVNPAWVGHYMRCVTRNLQPTNIGFSEAFTLSENNVVGLKPLNTGNIGFVTDYIYDFNGITLENADLTHGATAAVIVPANGNSTNPIHLNNLYGDVRVSSGIAGATKSWDFNGDGTLTLPAGGDIVDSNGTSVLGGGLSLPPSTTGYLKNDGSGTLTWDAITIPSTLGDLGITAGSNGQFLQTDGAGSYTWAYSGGYDQSLNTTDQVTFDRVINTTYVQAAEYKYNSNISGYGSAPATVAGGANTVVYSYNNWFTSAKLVIQIEGRLDGDNTGVDHTQTCEATIASTYNTADDPVMSVYGIVHTSPTPLATFTVNRNAGTIEILAENSQTTTNLVVKVQSIQFVSRYD